MYYSLKSKILRGYLQCVFQQESRPKPQKHRATLFFPTKIQAQFPTGIKKFYTPQYISLKTIKEHNILARKKRQ